jgi:hypothetical protein
MLDKLPAEISEHLAGHLNLRDINHWCRGGFLDYDLSLPKKSKGSNLSVIRLLTLGPVPRALPESYFPSWSFAAQVASAPWPGTQLKI